MQRTPEAIATSQKALQIGLSMLTLLEPNSEIFVVCNSGLVSLRRWTQGQAGVADCREASSNVHEMARLCRDEVQKAAVRSIGHAIATAHVSSHLKACNDYAKKALAQNRN